MQVKNLEDMSAEELRKVVAELSEENERLKNGLENIRCAADESCANKFCSDCERSNTCLLGGDSLYIYINDALQSWIK